VACGIRSLSIEEARCRPEQPYRRYSAEALLRQPESAREIIDALPANVYLTVALDALDPSVMPAVGTPEPGGLGWYDLLGLLRAVFAARNVVSADVVELAPVPGLIAPDFLAAKLVYKLISYRFGLPGPGTR
jgi:agmatinase